jgi:hypothetical protein
MQEKELFSVDKSIVKNGLLSALGKERLFMLMALASYTATGNGFCNPTQEELARDMGVTIQTVSKYIKLLKDFKWNGKPIITVNKVRKGFGGEYNIYCIHPQAHILFNGRGTVGNVNTANNSMNVEAYGQDNADIQNQDISPEFAAALEEMDSPGFAEEAEKTTQEWLKSCCSSGYNSKDVETCDNGDCMPIDFDVMGNFDFIPYAEKNVETSKKADDNSRITELTVEEKADKR